VHLATDEGSASLCSTVRDLARWQRAFDDHQLLGAELTDLARAPTRVGDGSTVRYGMGVDLSLGGLRQTVGHGGTGEGWVGTLVHDLEADLTVVVLANSSVSAVTAARMRITSAALALP
jgi:CubicO group peptidase (beta-lactamase class C family)